jgi:putative transposase
MGGRWIIGAAFWLGKQERLRFQVHDTPSYASWLNQVARWFVVITQQAIRRCSFSSVKELITKVEQFVAAYNKTKAPFNWSAAADSILEKLQRLCLQISGTAHWQCRLPQ